MNFLKSEWWYYNLFWNVRATNKGEKSNFANFDPKIGCHGNVSWLEPSEKGGQIGNLQSNTYHIADEPMVKIGPVYPEITLLTFIFKKNKLTEAEHTARETCMPRGLN